MIFKLLKYMLKFTLLIKYYNLRFRKPQTKKLVFIKKRTPPFSVFFVQISIKVDIQQVFKTFNVIKNINKRQR